MSNTFVYSAIRGSSGYSGLTGNTGVQGAQGAKGSTGVQGAQGAAGTNGVQGAAGVQGATGTGAQGASGYSGINGAQGTNGTVGSNGAQGASGYSGINGAQGTNGTVGSNGAQGASGYSGFSGTNQTLVTFVSANTFTAGQAIYRASGSFALAQANSNTTSDILGVVQSATSTQFTIVANGYITGLTGLTDSYQYYLSDTTPGALTTNPPSATGSVIKPVLIAIGGTAGVVVEYPGAVIGTNAGTSGYVAKWTSGSSQGNSIIQDNGTTVTVTGNLSATGNITVNGSGIFNKGVVASLIFGG